RQQGLTFDLFMERAKAAAADGEYNRDAPNRQVSAMASEMAGEMSDDPRLKDFFALNYSPRKVAWQLMVAGVFDRYPTLKYVPTEARADWVPATLAHMDARFERGDTGLKRRPSEYWMDHCFVGASFIHRAELVDRHTIGVNNLMFGRDYPHPEGTWPNTWDWLRASFAGVPENEARLILGENAIRCYGLDEKALNALAARIGPNVTDILGDHFVDPLVLDEFEKRGGFAKPAPPLLAGPLDEIMDEALARAR
ncbi:MAG: putative amidohydrolase, partial [Acidimicrobiia bacterium]|nr:putative amidohydrolase [Acidimicrobiia bacterium]